MDETKQTEVKQTEVRQGWSGKSWIGLVDGIIVVKSTSKRVVEAKLAALVGERI